jgi:hypothetical protein
MVRLQSLFCRKNGTNRREQAGELSGHSNESVCQSLQHSLCANSPQGQAGCNFVYLHSKRRALKAILTLKTNQEESFLDEHI